ncbi:MAG: heavy-metal-associated domain-containing protein [Alphaproteobacteria bacterium]|nr:heavy-metal-associated domain-containing protein [Alphaproteobacteria bacterium]
MKKFILTLAFIVLNSQAAFAGQVVKVGVNGMVCDFCARAIEKVFSKNEAVETVNVNLTEKQITASLKDGAQLSDEEITKMVNDSGYALVDIVRED